MSEPDVAIRHRQDVYEIVIALRVDFSGSIGPFEL